MSEYPPKQPYLSVVVITIYNSDHLCRCLYSLNQQVAIFDIEIIAVYDESIKGVTPLIERFPAVKFYCVPGRQSEEQLLAVGIKSARGKVIALTVDHCTPKEDWCTRIMEAHAGPYAAAGGAIEKGSQPDTALNWAIHFYDDSGYGYYQNPVSCGPAKNLSVCNVSYKREVLTAMTNFWKNGFHVPLINRLLLERGETLWLSPDIVVYQHRSMNFFEALLEPYDRGRSFARMRATNLGPVRRLIYTVLSPLLPLLLLSRLFVNILQKRSHLGTAIKALPIIILLATLWSWGEFAGYLTGRQTCIRC